MKTAKVNRFEPALDSRGNVVNEANGETVELVALTTTETQAVQVPDDAGSCEIWAVASGAATTIAFLYGGCHNGSAPSTLISVPTGVVLTVSCIGASALYARATGAAADLCIVWKRSGA